MRRRSILAVVLAAIIASSMVAVAATVPTANVEYDSHTTDGDFQNGTLTDLSIQETGSDASAVGNTIGDDIQITGTDSPGANETFQLGSYDSVVTSPTISLTGIDNTEWDNVSQPGSHDGDSFTVSVGGTDTALGPSTNDKPLVSIESGAPEKRWSVEHPDIVTAVAENDTHIFTTPDGTNDLKAIRKTDGSVSWSYNAGSVDHNGVTVTSTAVYTGDVNGNLYKIDHSGNEVWVDSSGSNIVYSLANNGTHIFVSRSGSVVDAYDSSGAVQWTNTDNSNGVYGIAASGSYVYTAAGSQEVRKIDSTGSTVWSFTGHTDQVSDVVTNGTEVYSTGIDGTVRKLNSTGGEQWKVDINGYGQSLALDGNDLFVGNTFANVLLFDAGSGAEKWRYNGHTGDVYAVAADGTEFYSGAGDNTAHKVTYMASDVDVAVDGTSIVSHTGRLDESETDSGEVSLATGDHTVDVTATGTVDVSVDLQEITETQDPGVELNGNSQTYSGTLNESESTSIDWADTVLQKNAENTINVSLPDLGADAPDMLVDYEFVTQTSSSFGSPEYVSETYSVANATDMSVNVSLYNAEGTFYYEKYDGSNWVTVDQTSLTTNGTHTLSSGPIEDSTQLRARVTFSDTGSDPVAELRSDTIFFQAHGAYVADPQPGTEVTTNNESIDLTATINDYEFGTPQSDSVTADLLWQGSTAASATLTAQGDVTHTQSLSTYYDTYEWSVAMDDSYGVSSTSNTYHVYGPLRFQSGSGMIANVTGQTDMLSPQTADVYPFSNTIYLDTSDGTVELVSNAATNASVAPADIEGTYTNLSDVDASAGALTANPADKAKLTVNGAATEVAWTDYAIDDGTVDTVISGPDGTSTDVTYYGLPSDLTMTAINASTGTPLAVTQSDGTGQATFTIDHSQQTVKLVSGDETETPEQSAASPVGDQSTEPAEFNVTVTDQDFPDDNVSVTIDSDGSQVHSTTITQNSTITTSMPQSALTGGEHTWTVNTTDKFGNVRVVEYDYTIPSQVYIYNETRNASNIHELIDGTDVSVRATLTGSGGTVVEDTISDGSFDLSGYDPTQTYILTVETDDYHVRSVYLPNLYEQNSIFLLNKSQPSQQNIITVEDRTGNYEDNPVLETQRVINTSNVPNATDDGYKWVTIAGDRLGADNTYTANFEQNKRYRFVVTNDDGDSRVLGEYVAETDQPINLGIGSIDYQFGGEKEGYEWTATIENTSSGGLITYAYNDYNNLTDSITLEIRDREDGTIIASETFTSGPYGELVYTKQISQSQYENQTWEVSWEADRDGETVSAVRPIGGRGPIDFGVLDAFWITAAFSLIALVLAFAVGASISAGAGGLAVAGWMGIAWYIGAVPTELGAGAIILAFLVSAWTTVNEQEQQVIQ